MPESYIPSTDPMAIRILVVDDDRDLLDLVEAVLTGAGYRVLRAEGGRKAIEVYESGGEPVHLLLTDVMMPDLTGPVVAERLRSRQPDLQVLFISGLHDADLLQRFVTRKGFALLPKPFTMQSLLRGVEDALKPLTFAA
jgi:two-component system, cell cycle sensor histidine kinase and response regulator CckA